MLDSDISICKCGWRERKLPAIGPLGSPFPAVRHDVNQTFNEAEAEDAERVTHHRDGRSSPSGFRPASLHHNYWCPEEEAGAAQREVPGEDLAVERAGIASTASSRAGNHHGA